MSTDDDDIGEPAPEEQDGRVRVLGGGMRLVSRRPRSVLENVMTFAAIPSVLAWTTIILLVGGDFNGAVQMAGAAFASFYVGWSFGDTG